MCPILTCAASVSVALPPRPDVRGRLDGCSTQLATLHRNMGAFEQQLREVDTTFRCVPRVRTVCRVCVLASLNESRAGPGLYVGMGGWRAGDLLWWGSDPGVSFGARVPAGWGYGQEGRAWAGLCTQYACGTVG